MGRLDRALESNVETETVGDLRPLRICLINPRFEPSYWGLDHAMPILPGGQKCYTVTGALPALAGLVPEPHETVLLDENVEDIDFAALDRFDVIGITGMIVQRARMFELLARLEGHRATIVVGGPYASVAPAGFEGRCDAVFVGEAETTWPAFLDDLASGRPVLSRYEQVERTDMSEVPLPRYDLLRPGRYMVATLQFSRGCPFLCEFCDIITIFGRRPRTKSPEQMLRELDTIRAAGFGTCFLVDDNFIGNKAKAREFLIRLIAWQERHGYPIAFSTEASINLADDTDLIDLMVNANFREVFIGIESPRESSLLETRKVQNVRGDGLLDKIRRIRDHGLVVQAGFIVGFDSDDERIFEEQFRFIQSSGVAKAAIALLTPIPTTPLYERLVAEGRLDADRPDLMFEPKQMSREILIAGHRDLLNRLYDPEAYFGRLMEGYRDSPGFRRKRGEVNALIRRAPRLAARLGALAAQTGATARLMMALISEARGRKALASYWRHWRANRRLPGDAAISYASFLRLCIEHWHYFRIARSSEADYIGQMHRQAEIPVQVQ